MRVSRQRGTGSWQKKQNPIKITQFIRVEDKLNDILKAVEREYWTAGLAAALGQNLWCCYPPSVCLSVFSKFMYFYVSIYI